VPTRHDFKELQHQPELRIQRWRGVAERSRALGEQLLADARSGALVSQARAFTG